MAAPEYVPVKPLRDVRVYTSPPRRPQEWFARRPGDLTDGQPRGERLGAPGPDQGYALLLAERFRDKVRVEPTESVDDVLFGATAVALKRASQFGRAPVIHDLAVALRVWGFLDERADPDLKVLRRRLFAGVSHAIHYEDQRRIVDAVPDDVLRKTPDQIERDYASGWRSVIEVPAEL